MEWEQVKNHNPDAEWIHNGSLCKNYDPEDSLASSEIEKPVWMRNGFNGCYSCKNKECFMEKILNDRKV